MSPSNLPIFAVLPELLGVLETGTRAILQAPPGAGKSTQVPLALLGASWLEGRRILMLEPRRLAASSLARFMAAQLGESVGARVGFRTRDETRVSERTQVEVVTEGILTRLLQQDPFLEGYACILFDEVHERSLQSDTGLALALDAQESLREDLRIVLMSATLASESLCRLLDGAPVIASEGRSYPVERVYRPISTHKPMLPQLAGLVVEALNAHDGSLLVFLPGVGEIRRLVDLLSEGGLPAGVSLAPLYGALTPEQQRRAIEPSPQNQRKVVLATAIAETSLTIEGVSVVIDSGLGRISHYDLASGLSRLETVQISRAAAEQRAGRAGRLGPGVCYRLGSREQHERRAEQEVPEMLRADLTGLALELAAWGVTEAGTLIWQDPPPAAHLLGARELLVRLQALDSQGRLTAHGRRLLTLGVHPRLAHLLCCAEALERDAPQFRGLTLSACDLVALLEEQDIFTGEARWQADLGLRLRVLESPREARGGVSRARLARVRNNAAQLAKRMRVRHTDRAGHGDLGRLLAWAYPERIAQQRQANSERYLLSGGRGAALAPEDPLLGEPYLVVATLTGGRNRAEGRIDLAAPIDLATLEASQQALLETRERVGWDARRRQPIAERQRCLGALVLARQPITDLSSELRSQAWIEGIRAEGLGVLPWTPELESWRLRVRCAQRWLPEESWPDLSDEQLLASLEVWLGLYLNQVPRWDQLKQLDLRGALTSLLDWSQQQRLDQLLPTHYRAPSGSRIRIGYDLSQPKLSVRLQEMFGETRTPCVADGRVSLLVELLSPAGRPVQLTQDLVAFWNGSYQQVRKEMKGRYPKHPWPEDPWQALPTRGTKRQNLPRA